MAESPPYKLSLLRSAHPQVSAILKGYHHIHLLLTMAEESRPRTPEEIQRVVARETQL